MINPMLHDVTNNVHNRTASRKSLDGNLYSSSSSASQSMRLMNKYLFGDANIIEEVKKRERKILKDINHFINAIAEVEKEIIQVRERQLPDIQYQISKKNTMCNELEKDILQLTSQLDLKEGECVLQRKNEEMTISNLQLKYSVEAQELETELNQKLDREKMVWEKQVLELELLKPSEQIAQEIKVLKKELLEANKELRKLHVENETKIKEYEAKLKEDFEIFKSEKEIPMKNLYNEQENIVIQKEKLIEEINNLEQSIKNNKNSCIDLENKILEVNDLISGSKTKLTPLRNALDQVTNEYSISKQEVETIQEHAHIKEKLYNDKFDKMEQEQLRRRKLENSIDELKGNIRCFTYISEPTIPHGFQVDYPNKSIIANNIEMDDNPVPNQYTFNRLVPSHVISEADMLQQEYISYHEMCLQDNTSFNLISVSATPWNNLRSAIINFLAPKYLKNYSIFLQHVFLSEAVPSQDMLLTSSENSDREIKLKIEEASIELDSHRIEIVQGTEDLPEPFAEPKDTNSSGINILKFNLLQRESDEQTTKKEELNFYFVEFYDPAVISILDRAVTQGEYPKTPITMILKKLLSDTKSCFFFNMNDSENLKMLLGVSQKVKKLKNPKKKKMIPNTNIDIK